MTTVDVDHMIKENDDIQINKQIRENMNKIDIKRKLIKPKLKVIFNKRFIRNIQPQIQKINIEEIPELTRNNPLKKEIFKLASLPIKQEHREKLNSNLSESKYLNEYLDKNLSFISLLNDNTKALACYGICYVNALKE